MSAWVKQRASQVRQKGEAKAPWYCHWKEPDGTARSKSCGIGERGKRQADRLAEKLNAELLLGTYASKDKRTWAEFRAAYDAKVLAQQDHNSQKTAKRSLDTFERVSDVAGKHMKSITAEVIAEFVAKRKQEAGRISKKVSPATVNRELTYVRAALRAAYDWEYIDRIPKVRFQKKPKRLPTFVPPEHFADIYNACKVARFPVGIPNVTAEDWWKALLTLAYLTGWRIGQIMSLTWEDIDLEAGTAVSLAENNKGRRDVKIPLHPVVVDHLRKLAVSFDPVVFRWNHNRRTLWVIFHEIQREAGTPKSGKEGWYGFHDLRRGFATEHAGEMDLFQLQALMQHQSLETTRGYVAMANGKLQATVDGLKVPDVLKPVSAG